MAQQGAAGVATAVAESVQYQGRKASRQGSEQRRQDILDAAMRIVVREGVRGVRHRAVAAEAGVPLSATTYYFKDIEDLLTDTFAQYVERSAAYMAKLWEHTEVVLRQLLSQGDQSPQCRARLADEVATMTAEYVQRQLHNRRDFLMAEQAFRQEALLCPRLAGLVKLHEQILLHGAVQMLEVVGSRQPQQDALVLTAIIEQMEYQGLLADSRVDTQTQMLAILTRYLHLVLAAV
ncbi:TetR/AcrR family transcriptional regulator [Pseudomonas sp. UM16]|uniref:TetR/AcrR family transcriptional regulator n=1 Tax=Pseudomonas sp. UM16 TaxID=3158962 RepID=UPI00398FF698